MPAYLYTGALNQKGMGKGNIKEGLRVLCAQMRMEICGDSGNGIKVVVQLSMLSVNISCLLLEG